VREACRLGGAGHSFRLRRPRALTVREACRLGGAGHLFMRWAARYAGYVCEACRLGGAGHALIRPSV
jgi:hypothetical protein